MSNTTPASNRNVDYLETEALVHKAVVMARANPAWFYSKILNFPALPWQIHCSNAVLDVGRKAAGLPTYVNHDGKPRITIRSCHGTGKTQFFGMLMHLWNFTNYGKIACTAPKQDQLLKRLLPRYRNAYANAFEFYRNSVKVLGREIIINGDRDWGAYMETASEPDNLAGYHDTPQLFLIDEAGSRNLDPMFPVIQGALTTPGSASVEIGNPTRTEGAFYEHHNNPKLAELYYRYHVKHSDAPDLISQQWIDGMRLEYGEESPIFKIRVLGEFASFDDYVLVPLDLIELALDDLREPDGSLPKVRISADIADGGADGTVITAAIHYDSYVQILKQKKFNWEPSVAIVKAADACIQMFEGFGGKKDTVDDMVIDANGVGAGTAGILIDKGYNVIRHIGSEAAPPYKNRRTANYMGTYRAFVDQTIAIAPDALEDQERFRKRLMSIKRASADRNDEIESKDKMKRDGVPSPDEADSLSMQFIDKPNEFTLSDIQADMGALMESSRYEAAFN